MKNILVFQHIAREHPSLIAEYAKERGHTLRTVQLWEEAVPPLQEYDALVILGGSMGVYDDFHWKEAELGAVSKALDSMPVLGICLGAQLIAHALGAPVYKHVVGGAHIKEVGHYDVSLTDEGRTHPLFSGFPHTLKVLQWHGDTFDIPEDSVLLAEAPLCKHQAFSHGRAHGLQFHVEATPELIEEWSSGDKEWASKDFPFDAERIVEEAKRHAPMMREQCYRLMDNFLSL